MYCSRSMYQLIFLLTETVDILTRSSGIKVAQLPRCAMWVSISWRSRTAYPHSSFIISQIPSLTARSLVQRLWRSVSCERKSWQTQWPPWKVRCAFGLLPRKCISPEASTVVGSLKGKGEVLIYACFPKENLSGWESHPAGRAVGRSLSCHDLQCNYFGGRIDEFGVQVSSSLCYGADLQP